MASGGDLREITWNNADVGSGRYTSKAGESHSLKLGGLQTDDSDDNMATDGTFINLKTTIPWTYEATVVNDEVNPNGMSLETLQALNNSFSPTNFTFTGITGVTYVMTGAIVGEVKVDRSKATIAFKAMGGGVAQQTT